jgi:hypothetical protein
MESKSWRFRVHRPSGLRGGIVLGLALALIGAAVGTATGAVTPFQQVVVVNSESQAIPVDITNPTLEVGAVKLDPAGNTVKLDPSGNTVDLGSTDSTHLANIDTATGKLAFDGSGNLKTVAPPQPPAVATKFLTDFVVAQAGSSAIYNLPETINATSIVVNGFTGDTNGITLMLNAQDRLTIFGAGGDVVVPLPAAMPVNKVRILCGSTLCEAWFSIVGF